MKCKQKCGDEVWWNATREQWVHYATEQAVCRFPGLPTNTLKATPEGDVHPLLRDELPSPVIPDDDPPQPPSDEQVLHALDPDNPYDAEAHGL